MMETESCNINNQNKTDIYKICNYLIWMTIAVILIMSVDKGAMGCIRWLFVCFFISIVIRPVFRFSAIKLPDEGFSLGVGLGIAVLFTFTWFISVLFKIPFNNITCILLVMIFASFAAVAGHIKIIKEIRDTYSFGDFCGKCIKNIYEAVFPCEENRVLSRKRFFLGFGFFALLFVIAFWIKGFKPMIDYQTEQYMDYGFMNAMYRQQKVPFEDMWYSGRTINYYYLGQAAAVFLCRLSFVTPEYGYNLMLCTIFAALSMMVYCLVAAIVTMSGGLKRIYSVIAGAGAALMCSCGGNGHWIIYGIIRPVYYKLTGKVPDEDYWFPTSTLFIGYEPETMDKAKHEFPSYTLVLGDLHAHVCNILFTIPLLAVLFDYAFSCKDEKEEFHKENLFYDTFKQVCNKHTILTGFFLGLFKGVNYWDFPIYFVVSGAVILFCDIKKYGFRFFTILRVLLKGIFILGVSAFVIFPFNLTYVKPVSGIHLADNHSPIDKLLIIWFVHVFFALVLLVQIYVRKHKNSEFSYSELSLMAITLCGLGLLLVPEVIYVKDIYGDEYQRYNTMFKLTFQGYILLSICAGTGLGFILNNNYVRKKEKSKGNVLPGITVFFCCALVILVSGYMGRSVKDWFGNVFLPDMRKGICASEFIYEDPSYYNVREAIDILNASEDKELRIIEEGGNSYSPENRLSVFCGATTVAGWYVHEWVWHNDSESVHERHNEVANFYTCGYEEYCAEIAKKYDLDYIYVGPKVNEKYAVDYSGFINLGQTVWESSDGSCRLIKVSKPEL
ncbi:MAG: hypothetical protein K6E98_03150 [Lachnospiraceae bacterium]|nr:hypothetical protein [Lachnospiraceae bacterium]